MKKQPEIDNKDEAGTSGNSENRRRKSIKFFISEEESQDSFVSALSTCTSGPEDDEEEAAFPVTSHPSKLVINPRAYATPREARGKLCVNNPDEFILKAISKQLMQKASSDPQCSNEINTRLIHAIYLRKLTDVKMAIENGANVNYLYSLETPLLMATELGDTDMVSYLLKVPNININQKNRYGQTALTVAVRNAFDEIINLLLNANADVNCQDHLGRTPLHNALFQERQHTVFLLLEFHANVELEDCFGERPIYTAAVKKSNLLCLKALLKEGASINYMNFSKVPLISRVIMNGTDFSIIETLIEFGASVNQTDLTSRTPLHYAALSNHLPAAKMLVENGALINSKSNDNFTPLDIAKAHSSKDVISYLEVLQPRSSKYSLRALKKEKKNSY